MNKVFIAAGGTGGHINAALAIGHYLEEKEYKVKYFSGTRELDYKLFKNTNVVHLNSLPLRYKNPIKILNSIILNIKSFVNVFIEIVKEKPSSLIGTGGYVCGPVLIAGFLLGKRIYILEQNSVMGLTNKILSIFATKVFYHFKYTKNLNYPQKSVLIGNPTRKIMIENKNNYNNKEVNVLIFGGSLGAVEINDFIANFLKKYKSNIKLNIVHQTGIGKSSKVETSENYKVMNYIDDMNHYYNWANLIICRSGASSISEIRIVRKPTFLIPYKHATDDHQRINAEQFKEEVDFPIEIFDRKKSIESNIEKLNKMIDTAESVKGKNKIISLKDPCEVLYEEINDRN